MRCSLCGNVHGTRRCNVPAPRGLVGYIHSAIVATAFSVRLLMSITANFLLNEEKLFDPESLE